MLLPHHSQIRMPFAFGFLQFGQVLGIDVVSLLYPVDAVLLGVPFV